MNGAGGRGLSARACAVVLALLLGACAAPPEPPPTDWFAGLPGVTRGGVPDAPPVRVDDEGDPTAGVNEIENPDGSVTLVLSSPRHVIYHLRRTLDEDRVEDFTGQVLSQMTRDEFLQRGLDPREAFTYLKNNREGLEDTLLAMRAGENTPGVRFMRVERNVFRLLVTGPAAQELGWTAMDVVLERGGWRLRWFGKPATETFRFGR